MTEPQVETTKHKPDAAFRKAWATRGDVFDMLMSAMKEVRQSITERLGKQQSKMTAELIALRARVKDLEAQSKQSKGMTYRGVWSPVDQYSEGDFVTHDGSMWHANQLTRSKPGTDATFQLAIKRGRDGKDAGR